MKIWLPINRTLGKLGVDADVPLKSETDFEKERTDTGINFFYYRTVVIDIHSGIGV